MSRRPPKSERKGQAIDRLFQEGVVVLPPDLLRRTSVEVRRHFGGQLDRLAEALRRNLDQLPARLLEEMVRMGPGRIEVVAQLIERTADHVGQYLRAHQVARMDVYELVADRGVVEEELVHLLDHWLGSFAQGGNLSEGAWSRPELEPLARELKSLHDARRAMDPPMFLRPDAVESPREFLAAGARDFILAGETLRGLDPGWYAFLDQRWFSETFWDEVLR